MYANLGYEVSPRGWSYEEKAKTQKEAVRSATVRLPERMHHELSVLLAQRRDTLAAMVLRAAARYLEEQDGRDADKKHFLDTAAAFWRRHAPDVREWVKESMEQHIMKAQR